MGGRVIPLLATAILLGVAGAAPAGSAAAGDVEGTLLQADWHGSVLTRGRSGTLCLVRGPDGSLRVEIAASRDAELADLLDRRGQGWTVVLAAGGDGTINPWDREWSRLDAVVAAGLRIVAEALLATAAGRPAAHGPDRTGNTERHVLPGASGAGGLRAALVRRGRGRGGEGETLILTRLTPRGGGPVLLVRSSRRPGSLRCDGLRCRSVLLPATETFVPLWPLRELLELGRKNPGTPAPAGG